MNLATKTTLNDGRKVPILGLGVSRVPKGKTAERVVACALDVGYRHFDTAWLYRNEASVGQAIRDYPVNRKDVWITTKMYPNQFVSPRRAIEASLKKLDLEYIDLYLLHWPPPIRNTAFEKRLWRTMESFREEGLCKSIGVSNYLPDRLLHLLGYANVPPAVNQIKFSPLHFHEKLYDLCNEKNVKVVGYSPLGRGKGPVNHQINVIAKKNKKSPAQIMLRWSIQKGAIPIPKSMNLTRIKENSEIFDFSLNQNDMKALDSLGRQ